MQSPMKEADFDLSTAVIDQPLKPSLKQTTELARSGRLGVEGSVWAGTMEGEGQKEVP